jgi:hypothetical protein
VECWLADAAPANVSTALLATLAEIARERGWGVLLARAYRHRPASDGLRALYELGLDNVGEALRTLVVGRAPEEVVTLAASVDEPVLRREAVDLTRSRPAYLEPLGVEPANLLLLRDHLLAGGMGPRSLHAPAFLGALFERVILGDRVSISIAGYLDESAGAVALDRGETSRLLEHVGARVLDGAADTWWQRYLQGERPGTPPTALRTRVWARFRARTQGRSVSSVLDLMTLLGQTNATSFEEHLWRPDLVWERGDHEKAAAWIERHRWRSTAKAFRNSDHPDLEAVAWYARAAAGFLGVFYPLPDRARRRVADQRDHAPRPRHKTTITFLAANPAKTPHLELQKEAKEIDLKLRLARHPDLVELKTRWEVTPDELQATLVQDAPEIVHFAGHGFGADGLVFHGETPEGVALISAERLSALFRALSGTVRLVVLNGCLTAAQAAAISKEVDFVIGMSDEIGDVAARTFAAALYHALASGRSVQSAFELGKVALGLKELDLDEQVPRLLTRPDADAQHTVLIPPA